MRVPKPAWAAAAVLLLLHLALWLHSLPTVFVGALPRLALASAAVENPPEDVADFRDREWVFLVCSEDAERVGPSFLSELGGRMPAPWRAAPKASPPPGVRVTPRECVGCTVFCTEPVFRSPLVSVVDSTWWNGALMAVGFRHVGVHLGPCWWPVHTSMMWLS